MSRYLIRRIEETPNIELHTNTEVVALEGNDHLERVTWRNSQTGQTESHNIAHLFSMTGAVPNSAWLGGCVACDQAGFIKTGLDLTHGRFGESQVASYSRRHTSWKPVCPVCSLSEIFVAGM